MKIKLTGLMNRQANLVNYCFNLQHVLVYKWNTLVCLCRNPPQFQDSKSRNLEDDILILGPWNLGDQKP